MIRNPESNILEEDDVEEKEILHRRGVFIVNILLWISGLSVIGVGIYVNQDLAEANVLVRPEIYRASNVLMMISGAIVVTFTLLSCSRRCLKMRMMLCVFTYCATLVFVLQCIVAALSFTWRNEVHNIVEAQLSKFIRGEKDYNSDGSDKFAAMDRLQVRFHCCGAFSYQDWINSSWFIRDKNRTDAVPFSCCKQRVNIEECSLDTIDNIDSKGCIKPLTEKYRENYVIIGTSAILVSVLQFSLFHITNCLIFNLK